MENAHCPSEEWPGPDSPFGCSRKINNHTRSRGKVIDHYRPAGSRQSRTPITLQQAGLHSVTICPLCNTSSLSSLKTS
jgi:hypothetical protein